MCLETSCWDQSASEDSAASETSKKQCSMTGAYHPALSIPKGKVLLTGVLRSEEGERSAIPKSSQLSGSKGHGDRSRSGKLEKVSFVSDHEDEFFIVFLKFTGFLIAHRSRGRDLVFVLLGLVMPRPLTIAWTRAGGCRNIMKLVSLWPMARDWRQDCVARAGHLGGGLGPSQTV